MASPSRFPGGLTTVKNDTLDRFLLPAPTTVHMYWEDFDYYLAGDWVVTETGVATQVLANEDGGVLLITNAASDDDASFSQKVGESYLMETGKQAWFEARLKVSDATQSDFVIGLQILDTTPLDVTDGIFFIKADGATTVDLLVEKDNTATTSASIATAVDATFIKLGFYYNGVDEVVGYVDGVKSATLATTNLPDDEELTISYGIQNGEASAKTMSIDYIFAAKER